MSPLASVGLAAGPRGQYDRFSAPELFQGAAVGADLRCDERFPPSWIAPQGATVTDLSSSDDSLAVRNGSRRPPVKWDDQILGDSSAFDGGRRLQRIFLEDEGRPHQQPTSFYSGEPLWHPPDPVSLSGGLPGGCQCLLCCSPAAPCAPR